MPKRIQRRRVRGWRLPENAVCVTRPGVFGNPFVMSLMDDSYDARRRCVQRFRNWLDGRLVQSDALEQKRHRLLSRLPELRGKDLACFCPVGQPCHADVLLEMANR